MENKSVAVLIILGLNHGEFNSSVAILKNGKLVAGAPEERFNREKKTKRFPIRATEYCLKEARISLKDCTYIAQAWNPGEYWQKFNPLFSGIRIKREDYFYTIPDNLYNLTERTPPKWTVMNLANNSIPPIYYVRHHLAHAANAFFLSQFKKAAILTCDWRGEFESTTLGIGKGNEIEILASQKIPHSLGMFYSAYTELLGYKKDSDEWKVMALSAFNVDPSEYVEKIRSTIKLIDDGLFELDQSYYQGALLEKPKVYTQKLVNLLGEREGIKGEEPDEWHFSVAKAMQIVAEEVASHMLNHLYKMTKTENLVLGGGFFMNSVYNGKITKMTPFKNIYISYAPADLGNSIGAALYVAHCIHKEKRDFSRHTSYIGPSFTDSKIRKTLERRKINFTKLQKPQKEIAKLLSKDNIVAFFNGRMEFGERALGNRSILADPRKKDTKDKINAIIKYREMYRPFAPAVLAEKAHIYFEIPKNYSSDYMEKVVPIKEKYYKKLPAVTHVDGSGRLQTVRKENNNTFYSIIKEFEKLTDFPVVLNTSFNLNGEPIVLSPDDALNTFFNSGLTHLIMGKFHVQK